LSGPKPSSGCAGGRSCFAQRVSIMIVAALLAGCAGGDGERSTRCEPASRGLVSAIETGLTVAGGDSLSNAFIVRSNDFENVFFVAARFEGEGMSDTVGAWATNRADGSGSVFAADSFAKEFSDWGDGPGFSLSDDGLSEARSCAEVRWSLN
jgi:hypothetical protein